MKVLLVDDEAPIIRMYKEKLQKEGFTVTSAENGTDAIATVANDRPDVILLDLVMPRTNGIDVLKKLKSDPMTATIPVYILTNVPEETVGGKKDTLGAAGYLFKAETEPQVLVEVLKKIRNAQSDGTKA